MRTSLIQGCSNMTGTDLYKRTHKSVPVIFEPPCTLATLHKKCKKKKNRHIFMKLNEQEMQQASN